MFQLQGVSIRRPRVKLQSLFAMEALGEAARGPEQEASAVLGPGWGVKVESSHRTDAGC